MKILQVMLVALVLSAGYVAPSFSAPSDIPAKAEMKKGVRPAKHHREMSKAMMNELNLSESQKKQWKALAEQKKAEMAPLREQMKKLHQQEQQINKKYEAKIRSILNAEQQAKYESMLPKKPAKPEGKKPHKSKK